MNARQDAMDMTARLFVRLWIDRGAMPDDAVKEMLILSTERAIADAVRREHLRCAMVIERMEMDAGRGLVLADALRRTPPP